MNDVCVPSVSLLFPYYQFPDYRSPYEYFPIILFVCSHHFPLYHIPCCIPDVPTVGSSSSLSLGSLSQNWPKNSSRNRWLFWERSTSKRRSRVGFPNAVWWFHVLLTLISSKFYRWVQLRQKTSTSRITSSLTSRSTKVKGGTSEKQNIDMGHGPKHKRTVVHPSFWSWYIFFGHQETIPSLSRRPAFFLKACLLSTM